MRPCASVRGTRWTRWTPRSYLSRENAPAPAIWQTTSLKPPIAVLLALMISEFQPRCSA